MANKIRSKEIEDRLVSNEVKIEPYKFYYDGRWDGIWDKPKYQKIRNKIRKAFKDLIFDEGPHKYYLYEKELTCVSNVTHLYQEHFDAEGMAQTLYTKYYNDSESKYFGMMPDEILTAWKDISSYACSHGTERHVFGESLYYFVTRQYDLIPSEMKDRLHQDDNGKYYFEALYAKECAAVKFYEDIPQCVIPLLPEAQVFSKLGYSGTFDLALYMDFSLIGGDDKNSGVLITDWKSNRDLYKNFKGKKLLHPFDELLDMPLSLYKLQLSLYQNCFEEIGLKVVGRRIMWLLPNGNYEKIKTEEYVNALREDISSRIKIKGGIL